MKTPAITDKLYEHLLEVTAIKARADGGPLRIRVVHRADRPWRILDPPG